MEGGIPDGRFDSTMLPEQHEDQLQLGFRIIQNSFKNKVHALEQELKGLKLNNEEQKNQSAALQRKNSALEVELVESHQRAQQLAEENKELFRTVQQLRKRIDVLEDLKKKVQVSLQAEATAEVEGENNKLYLNDDYMKGSMPLTMAAVQGDPGPYSSGVHGDALRGMPGHGMQPLGMQMGQPAPSYGQNPSPITPPPPVGDRSNFGGAAASPAMGGSANSVDGKQFFRMARSQLSYEAFNEFLANIKRLNNQQQTREETLEEARRIFGPNLANLYTDFEQLLNRHTM